MNLFKTQWTRGNGKESYINEMGKTLPSKKKTFVYITSKQQFTALRFLVKKCYKLILGYRVFFFFFFFEYFELAYFCDWSEMCVMPTLMLYHKKKFKNIFLKKKKRERKQNPSSSI